MRFYKAEAEIKDNPFEEEGVNRVKERDIARKFCKITMDFSKETYSDKGLIFLSSKDDMNISIGLIDDKTDAKNFAVVFLDKLGVDYSNLKIREVSMEMFLSDLSYADRSGLIEDDWAFSMSLGLEYFLGQGRQGVYEDKVVEEKKTVAELKQDAEVNLLWAAYTGELNRILKGKKQEKFVGHPAHYIIVSKNGGHRRIMARDIISALYKKGRLPSKRYTIVDVGDRSASAYFLELIYRINEGATVMLKFNNNESDGDNFKRRGINLEDITKIVKANCSKVLTIISVDSCSEKLKNKIQNALLGITLVDISEDVYYKDSAVKLIKGLAQKDELTITEDVVEKIKNSEKTFGFDDVLDIYNTWRHEHLGTQVFPEYKKFVTHELTTEKEEVKSDAYNELKKMIGLTGAKRLIDDAINYFKMQKEYRLRGMEFKRPSMHMVFTGSPGTAKTSVARLFARILKDNGILSVGNLIEVGRADIIGSFVGTTAPLVKETFARAKGSVLFIDEAYSLVDDKKGLYGDEAINTIVQEMENNREDTIVIFAGYQNEMETFLERNPGLNSRIAFHIPFDDYSSQELLDITKLIAKQTGFSIEKDADEKLIKIFDDAKNDESFGNGRFARNLIEKAKMRQADRLVKKDLKFVSDKELTCLIAEDFEFTDNKNTKLKLGFSA